MSNEQNLVCPVCHQLVGKTYLSRHVEKKIEIEKKGGPHSIFQKDFKKMIKVNHAFTMMMRKMPPMDINLTKDYSLSLIREIKKFYSIKEIVEQYK